MDPTAFDPERFRREGHSLIDQLSDYLAEATTRAPMPVLPWVAPATRRADWPADFATEPTGTLPELMARVLEQSNHLHHPRYVGHQVTSPLPLAALCELVAALLNNGMAVYEMGPVSSVMERSVIDWLGAQLGYAAGSDGVLTSGGSAGNLTGLLAARQARAGFDAWGEGALAGPPLAVLASEQTHYCVKRAVQVMGLGGGGVQPVPVDAHFRLRPEALPDALARAERAGRRVIAVVASAGSTSTGAFDPMDAIADFCAAHDLWMHVDGAHGASAVLSPRYRPSLRGIERADSVVWDMHKMMLMPALVTAVLFKDGARSYSAFAQEASYLFSGKPGSGDEAYDSALRTLECTKRMMSLKVYASLKLCGTKMFADYLESSFDLAKRFATRLARAADFELAVAPDCNIVCFRHTPAGCADLDALQRRIRQRICASGSFYLVQTTLPRGVYLRVTLINPLTTDEDLDALLDAVRASSSE